MTANVEHDFSNPLGACTGCGRYVEQCMEHRYCDQRKKPRFLNDPEIRLAYIEVKRRDLLIKHNEEMRKILKSLTGVVEKEVLPVSASLMIVTVDAAKSLAEQDMELGGLA